MTLSPKWIPSPFYNRSPNRETKAIVIHTAECGETPQASQGVGSWFQNKQAKVSAHYGVDAQGVSQYVKDDCVAWHASQVNDWTIGIELAGKASQTPAEWDDTYSRAVLDNAAKLVAQLCVTYRIPAVKLGPSLVPTKAGGIFGHYDVTVAYGSAGGHTDPGVSFPWNDFLVAVAREMDAIGCGDDDNTMVVPLDTEKDPQ